MARIVIKDALGIDVVASSIDAHGGLASYLKGQAAALVAGEALSTQLQTRVDLASPGETGLGLTWKQDIPLGRDDATLSVDAGAGVHVGIVNQPGASIVEGTFIGPPVALSPGQAVVSLSITPTIRADLDRKVCDLSFGFTAGSEVEFACHRPVDVTTDAPLVKTVLRDILDTFVVPASVQDLRQMRGWPVGAIASASGHGDLRVGTTLDVTPAFNPLASVDTLPALGPLRVAAAASLSVGVAATLTGGYQIRVRKLEGSHLEVSVHALAGRGFEVSVGAQAGPGITLGSRDLLGLLFRGPGGVDGASRETLVQGGLSDAQVDGVIEAMRNGLSRKVELALHAEFSRMREHDAAFVHQIDLDRLDTAGTAALDRALGGELSALVSIDADGADHGIRTVRSGTSDVRRRRVSWGINLVGIVNVLSMHELVRTGTVVHDPESGDLVVADAVSSRRMGGTVRAGQIRRLLYESAMMTVTYKASGLDVNAALEARQSFFFLDRHANRQRVSDYLDAVAALDLMPAAEGADHLIGDDDFGTASLLVEATFDAAACAALFGGAGPAPSREAYEAVGRRALRALVKPSDPDAYRRLPAVDDALWVSMREAGTANFRRILPPAITDGPASRVALRTEVVAADYSTIVWWASAMALAAKLLGEMRTWLAGRQPMDLAHDDAFSQRRAALEQAIAKAIQRNTATFDDPWGLVALWMAARGAASATAAIVSPRLTLTRPVVADH